MEPKRRYLTWGKYLKAKRELKFRSAREFCAQISVGISYAQYSRYESGEQLPCLEQALLLCKAFGVSTADSLPQWALAQLQDAELRGDVEAVARKLDTAPATSAAGGGVGIFTQAAVPLDDVIVFNRSHLNLFRSHPAYRDIFTYVNSFAPEWITATELAGAIEIEREKLDGMLDRLHELGVITLVAGSGGSRCRAAKRNFYFPDDEDFFELRNLNLAHNSGEIMRKLASADLRERKAYRGLVTRELTPEQLDLVVNRLDQLMSGVVALPETCKPERIYSVCLLMGERFQRPKG